jgi:hypothetical protein
VLFSLLTACGGGGGQQQQQQQQQPTTPTVTVTPASQNITTVQSLSVAVAVSGSTGTPTGSVVLKSGSYTSSSATLAAGSATISIPAGTLAAGSDPLAASYTPDTSSSSIYNSASGSGSVTVNKVTPTVTATPSAATISSSQAFSVSVTVSGGAGAPTPTGSVTLVSGGYTSSAATLSGGAATINVVAGSLASGADALMVTYTPDAAGSATYAGATGNSSVNVTQIITPSVTVTPASNSINTQQSLSVTVAVSGGAGNPPTATGSVTLTSGAYTSGAQTLAGGNVTITIPAATLAPGNDMLSASYTPDASSTSTYSAANGSGSVGVTRITPTVTVTPASTSANTSQSLQVTVAVGAPAGDAVPTGSVKLTGGGYTSASMALSNGSASITIPSGSLSTGSYTLSANYVADNASANIYASGNGTSAAITVVLLNAVSVDQTPTGLAVTDQLLGMNMAAWFDPTSTFVVPAFQKAGIKAIRWPGGSWSDIYHWNGDFICWSSSGSPPFTPENYANSNATYTNFISDLQIPAGVDVALTADYGTDGSCTKPGDPTEAAGWVQAWEKAGGTVSHVTVGNEEYGTWETDLHAKTNDPGTYATATQTYYSDIKAVDNNVLVGVDVDAGSTQAAWDSTVLNNAKGSYDFVEYHFYPQGPGSESDTYIVTQAASDLTNNINIVKQELKTAGTPNTPIYVGEIGSVYSNPGKQSWSITQGLYAGQVLGEMMSDGVSRLTWWIGFGNCNGDNGNDSASLYGWQSFGGYNVFADGPGDTGGTDNSPCNYGGPGGTMSPTAEAFNLMQNVLVTGENVLTPTVAGDIADVRAYAATHSGGTALVLFNLNETTTEPVQITLSKENSSSGVTVITYDKAIYDQTNANPPVWALPTTTNMGAQSLPLTLNLTPWSMNVILIQ